LRLTPQPAATPAANFHAFTRDIIALRAAHAAPWGVFPRLAAYRVEPDGNGAKLIFEQDRRRRKAAT
jgi:hypothetical protein